MTEKTEVMMSGIRIDRDNKGLSIPIMRYTDVNGEKYYKKDALPKRESFRTEIIIFDDDGIKVSVEQNEEFNKQVDKFTGEKDFIKKHFNF